MAYSLDVPMDETLKGKKVGDTIDMTATISNIAGDKVSLSLEPAGQATPDDMGLESKIGGIFDKAQSDSMAGSVGLQK